MIISCQGMTGSDEGWFPQHLVKEEFKVSSISIQVYMCVWFLFFIFIFSVVNRDQLVVFPPPRYNWNIVESGVKHHNPTHLMTNWNNKVSLMPISTIPEKNYSPLTSDWQALSPLATRFIYDLWILLLIFTHDNIYS